MPGKGRRKKGRGRNGTGWIREIRPGYWRGEIRLGTGPDGKPIRKSATGRSREEVENKLREYQQAFNLGVPIDADKLTVEDHLQEWLRTKKPPNLRPTTYAQYEWRVKYIQPLLGKIRLKDLDYRTINVFYEHLQEQGLSPRTIADVAALLRSALKDAVAKGLILRNPTDIAARPRFPKKEARFLTESELETFLAAAKGEFLEDLFLLAIHTGMRASELLGLTWANVDLEGRKLVVRQAAHEINGRMVLGDVKTEASRRIITLPTQAVDALKRQRKRQLELQLAAGAKWRNEHGLVFTNRVGDVLIRTNVTKRDLRRVLNKAAVLNAARRLGVDPTATLELNALTLPARPLQVTDTITLPDGRQVNLERHDLLEDVGLHTFRHTHAAMLIAAGVDILAVSRRLGHENVRITLDLYGHLMPGQDERAAQAMERIVAALGG